jgi:hypothetical protein
MKSLRKKIRVDFYEVNCQNGEFEEFVNAKHMGKFHKKIYHDNPYQITVDVFEETGAYLAGNFVKVQMNDIDPKFNLHTFTTESLPLEDDEGIPTGNVFLYLKKYRILFFQPSKMGITTNQFCNYFEDFCNTGQMKLNFVLSEEAFKKLASYGYISKVDIAVKGLDAGYILEKAGSTKSIIKKFKDLSANNLKIEISKGHRAQGLSLDGVKQFVRDVWNGMGPSDASNGHIIVTGRQDEDDELTSIDLVVSRYKKSFDIETSGSRLNSSLSTNTKLQGLKNMVNDVSKDLSKLFNAKRT